MTAWLPVATACQGCLWLLPACCLRHQSCLRHRGATGPFFTNPPTHSPHTEQGKTALVQHFQNSSLLHEDKRCRPILFHTDGGQAGEVEQFPGTLPSPSPTPAPGGAPPVPLMAATAAAAAAQQAPPPPQQQQQQLGAAPLAAAPRADA